jgi:hypothetical protein
MSDTFGSLIDKLFTVDMKMWNNQEFLYEIRKMSFEEYEKKYFNTKNGARDLWVILKKCCDLNVQRNNLIDEIDEKLIEIVKTDKKDIQEKDFIQKSHKTY